MTRCQDQTRYYKYDLYQSLVMSDHHPAKKLSVVAADSLGQILESCKGELQSSMNCCRFSSLSLFLRHVQASSWVILLVHIEVCCMGCRARELGNPKKSNILIFPLGRRWATSSRCQSIRGHCSSVQLTEKPQAPRKNPYRHGENIPAP